MAAAKPVKVAIIGGGCASIAAAFELSRPEHRGKYEITVYQLGWRLGGKGASGRGPADRIEEHGLHVWMGCYENSFRLMRECYSELNRDRRKCKIADWRDAFFPAPFVSLAHRDQNGSYGSFVSYFPLGDGFPGDPIGEGEDPFSVTAYLVRTVSLLRTMVLTTYTGEDATADDASLVAKERDEKSSEDLLARLTRLVRLGVLATTAGFIEVLGILELAIAAYAPDADARLVGLLEGLAATARRQLESIVEDDQRMLLLWQAMDIGITNVLGIIRFGLISDPRGFDAINDYDFREWMKLNGVSERSMQSPLIQAAYDLVFGYVDGDYSRPLHGAGVMLRGAMRMLFSSRGAIFFKMRAGMGDIVFAPFYEVLKKRGVSFEFFHRLEQVKLAQSSELAPGERPYVKALEFDVQATVSAGEYQPLFDLDGLPCWPSKPDFSQLCDGARLKREKRDFESHWDRRKVDRKTLLASRDFDFVVLGIGFGAVPYACKDFIRRDQRWRDMVERIKTVETQAFQIWMRDDMPTLGWNNPPVSLSAFVHPFDSWGDMGHVADSERWQTRPRAIAYFCTALNSSPKLADIRDVDYPIRRRREVRKNAIHFLNNDIGKLWPKAVHRKGRFKWETLIDPDEIPRSRTKRAKGAARFNSQYWKANVNPSDRYVLSLPGTQKYRISPLDNTYDNFTVAGDWTACGLDSGCVESAVISGRLAAHAISSLPKLEDIVGYDHP